MTADVVWGYMGYITHSTRITMYHREGPAPTMTFGKSGGRKAICSMDRPTAQAVATFLEESGWVLVMGRDNVATAVWHKR